MKKTIIIILLFSLLSVATFETQFYQEKQNNFQNLMYSGETENCAEIVFSKQQYEPEEFYNIIELSLNKYKANLYCLDSTEQNGKTIYTKYVYISDASLFNTLKLESGRRFKSNENDTNFFLSTEKTSSVNQIGIISKFDKNTFFIIKPLKNGLSKKLLNKSFKLILKDSNDFSKFENELSKYNIELSESTSGTNKVNSWTITILASAIVLLLLMLLIIYDLLSSYKKIAISKMLGQSNFKIFSDYIRPIIFIEFIIFSIFLIVLSLIHFSILNKLTTAFIFKIIILYFFIILITTIITNIFSFYIKHVKIISMLKNKKPTKAITNFNNIVKIILSTILIVVSFTAFSQFALTICNYKNTYSEWEKTKNLSYIHQLILNNEYFNSGSDENLAKFRKAYCDFNNQGAILAEFTCYSKSFRESNYKANKYESDYIEINPNYLKSNVIYDTNNKPITISETETNYILLVPLKYKKYEKQIIDLHKDYISNDNSNIQSHGEIEKFKFKLANQKVRIIWVKNNQKYFCYRLDINYNNSNSVVDAVSRVITENNGELLDYDYVAGYCGNPFKINSTNEKEIQKTFYKYFDKKDITFPVLNQYDSVKTEINLQKQYLLYESLSTILMLLLIIIVIIQNTLNYFEQNKKHIAVKKLLGYTLLEKYYLLFAKIFATWVISCSISILITKSPIVCLIVLIGIVVELLITIIVIKFNETKNTLSIIKGN